MNYFEIMCNQTGYRAQTTFWEDFTIADAFGAKGILDTYNRAFSHWKDNYIYLTELVMILNWKCWFFYEQQNDELSRLYEDLFYRTQEYALDNLKGNELTYFLNTTD